MAQSDRQRLLERAMALPNASASDFSGDRKAPEGVPEGLLKRIDDTSLRSRLIAVGLAEGLQSPKGPQKIASILRVYPGFDAPPKPERVPRGSRQASSTRGAGKGAHGPRPVTATVDELESLISRIRAEEAAVAQELHVSIDAEIQEIQHAFGSIDPAGLEEAHMKLGAALGRKRESAKHIRSQAFERISRDASFAPRTYLKLFATE